MVLKDLFVYLKSEEIFLYILCTENVLLCVFLTKVFFSVVLLMSLFYMLCPENMFCIYCALTGSFCTRCLWKDLFVCVVPRKYAFEYVVP